MPWNIGCSTPITPGFCRLLLFVLMLRGLTRLYQASKRSADGTFLTHLTALCPDSLAAAIADLFNTGLTSGNQESPFPTGVCCCLRVFPSALSRVGLRMAAALPTGLFRVKLIFWVASGTAGLRLCKPPACCLKFCSASAVLTRSRVSLIRNFSLSCQECVLGLASLLIPCGGSLLGSACRSAFSAASSWCDGWSLLCPDASFTDQLCAGVSLGVRYSCSVMAPGLPPDANPRPLKRCASSWTPGSLCLLLTLSWRKKSRKAGSVRCLAVLRPCVSSVVAVPSASSALSKHLDVLRGWWWTVRCLQSLKTLCCRIGLAIPLCPTFLAVCLRELPRKTCLPFLDVSKAHRRIKIPLGPKTSLLPPWRQAGLICRLLHRIIFVSCGLLIYVDDLLCLLRKCTSPLLAALLVLILSVLRVPMSILAQGQPVRVLSGSDDALIWSRSPYPWNLPSNIVCCSCCSLFWILGVSPGVTWSVWQASCCDYLAWWLFWPTLAPLYSLQCRPACHGCLNSSPLGLLETSSWCGLEGHGLYWPSFCAGSRLVRLARLPVSSLSDVPSWLPESGRVWIQVSHHRTASVPLSDEVREVLSLRKDFLHQSTWRRSIVLAPAFGCEASADACADSVSAGLGAFVKFPCATKRFFQVSFAKAALCQLCPFMFCDDSPQSFIAALEILAQSALVWTIQSMLLLAHPPLRVVLCTVLRHFCDLQRRCCISARVGHVPGFLNDAADGLRHSEDPASLGFADSEKVAPPWREFLAPFMPQVAPLEANLAFRSCSSLSGFWGGSRCVKISLFGLLPTPSALAVVLPIPGLSAQSALSSVLSIPTWTVDFLPLAQKGNLCRVLFGK